MKVLFIASFASVVADPAAARRLFVDGFELHMEGVVGDYLFTEKLGGAKHFGLWPLAEAAQACFGKPEWPAHLKVPQACVEFEVEDVEAAAAELTAKGHTILHPVRDEPWGQTIARVLSPDGMIVGVCRTPHLHAAS
jgi:catechol 2,3-dioxygenase-like lactoylglutathione lyase family enzyme